MLTRSYKVKDLFVVYYNGIKNQDNEISKLREKTTKNIRRSEYFLSPNYGKLSINLKMLLAFGNGLKCIIAYSRQAVCIFITSLLGRPNSNDF
jgi:hypothetical protein